MFLKQIKDVLAGGFEKKQVDIRGWVYRKRKSKDTIFIIVRDTTGLIQCTIKKGSPAWKEAEKVTIESSITITGIVKGDERAPGGYEISSQHLVIIGLAETFPITKDQSEKFRRDVRHLWLRSQRMGAVMKVRSEVLKSVHDFFEGREFIEVSPPMFISNAVEGGATIFEVDYFGMDLYLSQSAQLYLEALTTSLEKVYCIAPSFRAEKSRTIRHLAEYWHVEAEQAFATIEDLFCLEEDLITYVCQKIVEKCKTELEILNIESPHLVNVTPPFNRITYDEALEMLQKDGFSIQWGADFGFEEEKALTRESNKPLFVYAYPREIKAFYCKTYVDNPKLVMSADLLVPRIGELTTGGSRIDDKEKLIKRLQECGLRPEDYDWYIDLRRYGSVPHVGFGLGIERLLAWMLDLQSVMDAIPFPRTLRRYYP